MGVSESWNAVGARGIKSWPAVPELPRRVDAVSGRRRRVSPRGGQALTRSGARRGAARAGARRQARRGAVLGWAERGEARAGDAGWTGFGRRARSEAAAREGEKSFFFQIYFQGNF